MSTQVRALVLLLAAGTIASGCAGTTSPSTDAQGPAPQSTGPTGPAADAGAGAGAGAGATDAPPSWTGVDALDITVTFADGLALPAGTEVDFVNGLGEIRDWELVGPPGSTTTDGSVPVTLELTDPDSGCRVLDERAPYPGEVGDDEAASLALVDQHLAGADLVAGPAQNVLGIGEGLGEGGPTYAVARALGREVDGGWRLVTARAFTTLGAQQVTTVTCPTGAGIDVAQGQIAMTTWVHLSGLERYP